MGLRQSIKSTGFPISKEIEFRSEIYSEDEEGFDSELVDLTELGRWYKHPNLNGWMESLYRRKGGTRDFNCILIKLELIDLLDLRFSVQFGLLPETEGWGFGKSSRDFIKDLDSINKAILEVKRGRTVFYECEW